MERRTFIKNTSLSGLALSMPISGNVLGKNDKINLAIIGVGSKVKIGGKGKQDLRAFMKIPGVNVVAICDCDEDILREEEQNLKKENINVKTYKDFRKLLEDKDIDAVSITTPNHTHALITVMACQAGKHVYCQKPASHNVFEGRKMVEAARKYKRVVQVPHGARVSGGMQEAFAYARTGKLGKIEYVHGLNYKPRMTIEKVQAPIPVPKSIDYNLWSGPAPMSPVQRKYFHYDWHWMWEYGSGDLGNMGIHYVDGCRMAINANYLPKHVMSIGGRYGYSDDGQTPNTQILYFEYDEAPVIFEVRGLPNNSHYLNSDWKRAGRYTMDEYRGVRIGVVVQCEDGYTANNQAFDNRGRLIETFTKKIEGDKENFIRAVKNNDPDMLYTDVEVGHLSASLVHLGNASYRLGQESNVNEINERIKSKKSLEYSFDRFRNHLFANRVDLESEEAILGPMLSFDSDKEQFVGEFAQEANKVITREYREPFTISDTV